jgi:hypothetical protein
MIEFVAVLVSLVFEIVNVATRNTLPVSIVTMFRFWRLLRISHHTVIKQTRFNEKTKELEALRNSADKQEAFNFEETVRRITRSALWTPSTPFGPNSSLFLRLLACTPTFKMDSKANFENSKRGRRSGSIIWSGRGAASIW